MVPDIIVANGVVDQVVEEVADPVVIVKEVVEEASLEEVARMVQPDVNFVDLVPFVTTDTEITAPPTENFI